MRLQNGSVSAPQILHRGEGQCPQASAHNRWLQIKPQKSVPRDHLGFLAQPLLPLWRVIFLGFCMFQRSNHKAFGLYQQQISCSWPAVADLGKRGSFKSSLQYMCLGVLCCMQIISKSIWHWSAAPEFQIFAFWVTKQIWILERLAFAPSGGPARISKGCFSETQARPLASHPLADCQCRTWNSILALPVLLLRGVPTTVYCQNQGFAIHFVHWVLNTF